MALSQTSAAARVHYAWVIVAIALLVVFAALGLARFSFGMLLPAIAEDLGLNYRQQGFLSATYFAGYLAIVFVLPWLAPRLGPRLLCGGGLAVTALAMFVMSAGFAYPGVASSYFIAGFGSAAAFVGAMSLPSFWFHPSHRARGAGVAVAGAGVGILFSGLLVPRVTDGSTVAPWQLIWTGFAALTLVVSMLAFWYLRNRPAALGLPP
ncbi:MAG: MFS transporter [Pseudomonadota bacterium]|nr:MFS transporter [Pseudomonadota bacterium]